MLAGDGAERAPFPAPEKIMGARRKQMTKMHYFKYNTGNIMNAMEMEEERLFVLPARK